MNQGQFVGYLGRDAEMRYTGSGQAVSNFNLGVSVGFGDRKHTLWVKCALWGKQAESLTKYLTKGKQVGVAGRVDLREWTNRDDQKQFEMVLDVSDVTLCGGGEKKQDTAPAGGSPEISDEDIPF